MKSTQLKSGCFVTHAVKLVRPLAEGGMGRVWLAEHHGLKTEVVVKLMADEIAERPDGAERFAREAAIAAAIKSPHVVQVFDHGVTEDGVPYIVMERLEGRDLAAHLAEHGRMAPTDVVALVVQVGKALAMAHKASIVHRDIKPENIFLCDTDGGELFVKLLDFGTARRDGPPGSSATVPGQIMGTPHYMSPEQSVGGELDGRSDIWSLGVVAFEALTGRKPFDGASVGALTIAIHGVLPKMTELVPELPPALDAWFARACAQSPSERFANVRELTDALALAVTGKAPVDPSTEAIHFPPVEPANTASTPPRPVTRPIGPLSASLPAPGAAQRPTAIAAGIVMALTAVAMLAIVVHRSPAPPPTDEVTRGATQAAAPEEPGAAAAQREEASDGPNAAEESREAAKPRTAAPAARRTAPATTRTAQSSARTKAAAKAPAKATAKPTTKAPGKDAKAAATAPAKDAKPTTKATSPNATAPNAEAAATDDDDLVRLRKATTEATANHTEGASGPAAPPPEGPEASAAPEPQKSAAPPPLPPPSPSPLEPAPSSEP